MSRRWNQRNNPSKHVSLTSVWSGSNRTILNLPYVGQWLNSGYPFNVGTPTWIDETLNEFTYGEYGEQTLSVSYTRGVEFSVSSGSLPTGISLSSFEGIASFTGTVTSKSSYSFTVRATGVSNGGSIEKTFSGTPTVNKIVATGGTTVDHNGYRVHYFTGSSNFVITSGTDDVEYALLGGGGGGSSDGNGAGGGGAGGYISSTTTRKSSGTYPVVVGGGGAVGTVGTSTTVFGFSGNGGGRGGPFGQSGGTGGNGGGGGGFGGGGFGNQNYNGGSGGFYNGGGGAGISAAGLNGNSSPNETGGNGGAGAATPPSGWLPSQVTRGGGGAGGGGGGGGTATGGTGGGGNGNGAATGGNATQGAEEYGAGGGGGYFNGAKGGSGYAWVRYLL